MNITKPAKSLATGDIFCADFTYGTLYRVLSVTPGTARTTVTYVVEGSEDTTRMVCHIPSLTSCTVLDIPAHV